jgi:hypothetical protein
VTLVLNLQKWPLEDASIDASMSIDNLSTQIEVQVICPNVEKSSLDFSTLRFRQSGFADVRLHWEQVGLSYYLFFPCIEIFLHFASNLSTTITISCQDRAGLD